MSSLFPMYAYAIVNIFSYLIQIASLAVDSSRRSPRKRRTENHETSRSGNRGLLHTKGTNT